VDQKGEEKKRVKAATSFFFFGLYIYMHVSTLANEWAQRRKQELLNYIYGAVNTYLQRDHTCMHA